MASMGGRRDSKTASTAAAETILVDGPPLPPLLFPGSNRTERRRLAQLKAARRIRLVGPRLYVSVPETKTEETVRQSWSTIVSELFPGALLSHRTALEFSPSPEGFVYITATTNREVQYPGLTLAFVRGPAALQDDSPFLKFKTSSLPRALLENLSRRAKARVVPIEKLEARLQKELHVHGETALNNLRDRARAIADELGWHSEFQRLDALIGTLLGTRKGKVASSVALARAAGEPFDPACLERIGLLFAELQLPMAVVADAFRAPDHFRNKAFFEAYFSNYIEGTTFEIAEAEAIIFDRKIPPTRPKDAHDVLGTFEIVSDEGAMRRIPQTFDSFLELIRGRHAKMMNRRPEAAPGELKTEPNRAGDTHFVHPEYVRGTLRKGWELSRNVPAGLPRAIFMAFLLSDVHPFVDGNGRMSRIMMNAELIAAGQTTVIIPTVYRDDYLQAQRALTRRHRPTPIIEAISKAQRFSSLEFSPYPTILADLTRRNWFRDPDEARIVD